MEHASGQIALGQDGIPPVAALFSSYEFAGRHTLEGITAALETASARIEREPVAGLPAPRPYPRLAKPERLWLHVRPYWVAYRTTSPPVISAVFYDAANIPGRI